MKKLPYRAVVVDFDRTLLHTDKTISGYTAGVLRKCQEGGARLFAATARPERAITEYCKRVAFDAVTTLNGARTVTSGAVCEYPIAGDEAEAVLEQLHRVPGAFISVETDDGIYSNRDFPLWQPAVMEDLRGLPGERRIYKVLASHPEIPADRIPVILPDNTYSTVADRKLLQVMSRSATKWNGVRKMLEAYGIDPAQAVYFGDDNDDIEPIRNCGCGVAVSNALDCVKGIADYITGSNDEDGVAAFLAERLADGCQLRSFSRGEPGRQAILLNGPSSSGKSTLSKALQSLIGEKRSERYEVVSIDDFMKTEPMETIYEDDVFEISGDMCEKAAEILAAGNGVIIDHVITSERIFAQLKEALGAYSLRTVRVTCPPEILRRRELDRGDRCPGSAEASDRYLYPKEGYDLTVDTGSIPPEENAALILDGLF